MRKMLRYELKKIYMRTGNRIAALLLIFLLGIVCWLGITGVEYIDENGNNHTGFAAAQKLRAVRQEWAGPLTEEKISKVIGENNRINATPEAQSEDVQENNRAFGWKQGIYDIRKLLVNAYGEFREYDYYIPDSLSPKDAGDFYPNRVRQLKRWLYTEAKDQFTEKEKVFLIRRYEELEIPLQYDYAEGWKQLLECAPMLLMVMVLILSFPLANIFPGEFQWKADAVFYTSYHGRGKAVSAKIKAGLCVITGVYWMAVLLVTGIILGVLGADGAGCPIQTGSAGWKSFYSLTYWQEYLLIMIGGYLGSVFILLFTMLLSAKTKSSVVGVIIPFVLIFLPTFLSGIGGAGVRKLLGLLPDQLLQMNRVVSYFNLYDIGGMICGAVGILLVIYAVLSVLLCPFIYRVYRKAEVN